MSEQRPPDIEIYVKSCSVNQLEQWLESCGSSLQPTLSQGAAHEYKLTTNQVDITVLIHEKVAGKAWTSVWFKSDKTPWMNDLECARQAIAALNTQIRCIAGGWSEGDDPDEWWKLEKGEEELIKWLTN
jgi:hypothetical protein